MNLLGNEGVKCRDKKTLCSFILLFLSPLAYGGVLILIHHIFYNTSYGVFYPTSKSAQKFKVEKYLEIFI